MGIYVRTLDDYLKSNRYGSHYIVDDRIKDKEFRKKLVRDYFIEHINAIEKCIADKSRIISDATEKTYRKREYETCCFYPDGKGGLEARNEAIWVGEGDFRYQDSGVFLDSRLTEYIYYNSSIPYIYHLEYLEFINGYKEEERLSVLNLIYPAKMPTKDYFPFIEFDLGTKIPIMLTEKEKEKYKESLDDFSNYEIEESSWNYCILWIDKDRMFINLYCEAYYFKQVGKNVHLFELTYQCV